MDGNGGCCVFLFAFAACRFESKTKHSFAQREYFKRAVKPYVACLLRVIHISIIFATNQVKLGRWLIGELKTLAAHASAQAAQWHRERKIEMLREIEEDLQVELLRVYLVGNVVGIVFIFFLNNALFLP